MTMHVENPLPNERIDRPVSSPEEVARTLDCRGMVCPLPIFKTTRELAAMAIGEVLEVTCTDPGALSDFRALAHRTGHELLLAAEEDGVQRFRLRKVGSLVG